MNRMLGVLLFVSACAESGTQVTDPIVDDKPVDPCPQLCPSTSLSILRLDVIYSNPEKMLYSGDSLIVNMDVASTGGPAKAYAYVTLNRVGASGGHDIVIPRNSQRTYSFVLKTPVIHTRDTATADFLDPTLSWQDSSGYYSVRLGKTAVAFTPNYMQLSGPDTLSLGRTTNYTLKIVNQSPNAIHSADLNGCIFYFNCRTPVFFRGQAPTIAARSTYVMTTPVTLLREWDLDLPAPGYVSICYGYPGDSPCGYKLVTMAP